MKGWKLFRLFKIFFRFLRFFFWLRKEILSLRLNYAFIFALFSCAFKLFSQTNFGRVHSIFFHDSMIILCGKISARDDLSCRWSLQKDLFNVLYNVLVISVDCYGIADSDYSDVFESISRHKNILLYVFIDFMHSDWFLWFLCSCSIWARSLKQQIDEAIFLVLHFINQYKSIN